MAIDLSWDKAVLKALGRRLAWYRLNRDQTQEGLAMEAGVSLPTVQRIEYGHSTQTSNLIRVLHALGLLEDLDGLVPESRLRPLQRERSSGSPEEEI
jgi:transcriptional regulator with XRE-family HTH domain